MPTSRKPVLYAYQRMALFLDFCVVVIAVLLSAQIADLSVEFPSGTQWTQTVVVVVWMSTLVWVGSYERRYMVYGAIEYRRVVKAAATTFLVAATLGFFAAAEVSRLFVVFSVLFGCLYVLIVRALMRVWIANARARGRLKYRTLLVATGSEVEELTSHMEGARSSQFDVVATFFPPKDDEGMGHWVERLSTTCEDDEIDVLALSPVTTKMDDLVHGVTKFTEQRSVTLLVAPSFETSVGTRVTVYPSTDVPFLVLDKPHLLGGQRVFKRFMDILGSVILLILTSPIFLVAAIGVKLSGDGPIFYKQKRVGLNNKLFDFVKFRTMFVGADEQRADIIGKPDEDISERYKSDPRITPFGKFLRRWSFDELPQLVSVFKGTMSLVGPRPMLPDEIELLSVGDNRRHIAKPGLTGLWQVSGRKDTTWDERMSLDLEYVRTWSPLMDVVILWRTLWAVVTAKGAY